VRRNRRKLDAMVQTKTPPFRADHVGSLLRPPELLQAREDEKHGRISAGDLRRVEDQAIRDVVRRQEELGLEGVTDGEFRRASWHMDFLYQVGGTAKVQDNVKVQFRNEQGVIEFTPAALQIKGKLTLDKCIFGDDFAFLKSVAHATPKLTIPSPSMMHYRSGRAGNRGARQAGLHLSSAGRHQSGVFERSGAARAGQQDGRRRRARAYPAHQNSE